MTYNELSKLVKFKMIKEFLEMTTEKKKQKSTYYRNEKSFQLMDHEMEIEMRGLRR